MPLAVVQARMGSSRLPGKVLRPLGTLPVLSWVLRAARAAHVFDTVVVATTHLPEDDAVADVARAEGAVLVRGDVDDVLARFRLALDETHHDGPLVRLTADCPLLDPAVIRMAVAAFDPEAVDYLSTVTPRTLPRGLDVEVVSAAALRIADEVAHDHHRAHVTSYIAAHPDRFRLAGLTFAPPAPDLRVTLDTPEDDALLQAVVAELGDGPHPWRRVVSLLRSRPDLVALNGDVRQKALEEG